MGNAKNAIETSPKLIRTDTGVTEHVNSETGKNLAFVCSSDAANGVMFSTNCQMKLQQQFYIKETDAGFGK